jgi:hypothetical protein
MLSKLGEQYDPATGKGTTGKNHSLIGWCCGKYLLASVG